MLNGARGSQGAGVPAFGGGEEPGQVSDQQPAGQAAAPSEAERPLTRAEFEQAMELQRQALARQIQSQTDKAATHIQRRFQAAQDGFTRAAELAVKGGFIPADKQEAYALHLRQAAMQDALTPEQPAARSQQPRNGNGQRPAPEQPDDSDPGELDVAGVNAQAQTLAQQYGLAQGDPELEHVITDGSPADYLTSIRVAGRAKARRLQAANPATQADGEEADPEQAQTRQRRAAARAPGVGPTGGKGAAHNEIANINDPDKLYDLEWQKRSRGGRAG